MSGGSYGGDSYQLLQAHLHWGCTNGVGSEHTINGRMLVNHTILVKTGERYFFWYSERKHFPVLCHLSFRIITTVKETCNFWLWKMHTFTSPTPPHSTPPHHTHKTTPKAQRFQRIKIGGPFTHAPKLRLMCPQVLRVASNQKIT